MMNGAGWFVLGAFTAALVIFVVDTLIEWRQERLDRQNAEALTQIKEAISNEPLSFGFPIVESDMVPDDKIYVINPEYLIHGGDRPFIVGNKQSMDHIRNIGES